MSRRQVTTGNAVIWVAVILAAAVLLKGSPQISVMIVILTVAAGVSLYLVANGPKGA